MKTRGIVRKIDELGRIVLPIELRKLLQIEEGDPIEITCADEEIVLKKKGALQDRERVCLAAAQALYRAVEKPVFVFDTQHMVARAGGQAPEEAMEELTQAVRSRKPHTVVTERGDHIAVVPLMRNGELYGGVGIVGGTDEELRIGRACCEFFSQYV